MSTEVNENGVEIAIFDEEIVELGSAKWNKTVCGQFLGCMINFNEARYHLRRMWNKYGFEDMTVNDKGVRVWININIRMTIIELETSGLHTLQIYC